MRVLRLSVRNFKGIEAAEIFPEAGKPVSIAGKNGSGKTSVLDALECALRGKKYHPDMPIRHGAKKSEVEFDLGDDLPDIKGVRTFTKGGQRITLTPREGYKIETTDQAFLDRITDARCFDPMAFASMKPAGQREVLIDLLGLDLEPLDTERQAIFDARTEHNRTLRVLENTFKAMRRPTDVERVNVGTIQAEIADLQDTVTANNETRRLLEEAQRTFDATRDRGVQIRDKIEGFNTAILNLQKQVAALGAEMDEVRVAARDNLEVRDARQAFVDVLVDPNLPELMIQLNSAQESNAEADAYLAWTDKKRELEASASESEKMDRDIEAIDDQKVQLIAEADMPIAGLSFDDSEVFHDGTPLTQVNFADRCEISARIGMQMKPELRIMRIEHGSALDDEHLARIVSIADEEEYQVWIETVLPGADSIVIEEGRIAE